MRKQQSRTKKKLHDDEERFSFSIVAAAKSYRISTQKLSFVCFASSISREGFMKVLLKDEE